MVQVLVLIVPYFLKQIHSKEITQICIFSTIFFLFFIFIFTRTREVVLPKFKLEKNYNLIGFLRSMGIEELFSEKGNYCGVSEDKVSIDRVFIPLLVFTSFLTKRYHLKTKYHNNNSQFNNLKYYFI
mgnify:CR=1 FL=1